MVKELNARNPGVVNTCHSTGIAAPMYPLTTAPGQQFPVQQWFQAPSSFTPEVETLHLQDSYRFKCPGPGVFQCTLTGLVFVMLQEAKLRYNIIQWDESILQSVGKIPAGPLYNISCSNEAVHQLHLPHCEITDVLSTESLLSVIHISNDDGLNILEPLKITDSHVIVKISSLSAFGLVWDYIMRFTDMKIPVASQVLLYLGPLKPKAQNQKLYVFLLPRNIPKREVSKDQKDCKCVRSTSNCKLIKDQIYTLACPAASHDYKIQPERAEFDLNFGEQYHPTFEIRLPINTEVVGIIIKDEADSQVWKYDADLTEYSQDDVTSSVTVPSQSTNLPGHLLNILEDLREDEFGKLRWLLKNGSQDTHFRIKESATRLEVVDQMLKYYSSEEAPEVMKKMLRSIGRNDLVKQL
ncbi:uncharacterized protein FYW61_021545 isoform 1-T3 [Anableps anableps]